MRYTLLVLAAVSLAALLARAAGEGPVLLKGGEAPPKGWSVIVFKTDSMIYGGRIKVGGSERCENTDTMPCHFAVPDGPAAILVDQPLEHGDTVATLSAAGERIYVVKTGQHHGRAAARAFGGLLGAMLSQPDDAELAKAKDSDTGPLAGVRKGSRFDIEFVSVSEPGKAATFVAPKTEE